MADSSVTVLDAGGVSRPVDAHSVTGGDFQQVVREARATAVTTDSWTITTAGLASKIAADATRVKVLLVNNGGSRVWLRFDSTVPTPAAHHWYLDGGDRYEVPIELTALAVSMAGQNSGGDIKILLATAA